MSQLKKHGSLIAAVFGLLAVVMLFLKGALSGVAFKDTNGFVLIFGKSGTALNFNAFGFIALLLLVVGTLFTFLPLLESRHRHLVSAILLLAAGIFMFVFPGSVISGMATKIGLPMILAGVFTLLGAGTNALLAFLK